jgi:hypothetical protein
LAACALGGRAPGTAGVAVGAIPWRAAVAAAFSAAAGRFACIRLVLLGWRGAILAQPVGHHAQFIEIDRRRVGLIHTGDEG